jgi:large subunit ribosomal protein L30
MIKIRMIHSACDAIPKHKGTIRGLGFRKVNHERLIVDTPETRGMVKSVAHLVKIVEEGISQKPRKDS